MTPFGTAGREGFFGLRCGVARLGSENNVESGQRCGVLEIIVRRRKGRADAQGERAGIRKAVTIIYCEQDDTPGIGVKQILGARQRRVGESGQSRARVKFHR